MNKRRRFFVSAGIGVFVLYNVVTGGGIVIERRDSLAQMGVVANATLPDGTGVFLKETPTSKRYFIPFLFYYFRETYPFRMRYYGPIRDSSTIAPDEEDKFQVVITEVRYRRVPGAEFVTQPTQEFRVSSWEKIVIPDPGPWIVETKGYGRFKEIWKFPTLTIQETERGRMRITGFLAYMVSGLV